MMSLHSLSPVHDKLALLQPVWSDEKQDAKCVLAFGSDDKQNANILGLADLSHLRRTGAKGKGTAKWLSDLGLPIPNKPNSWLALPQTGMIARLGETEFLIESNPQLVERIIQADRVSNVYPVLRQDAAFALCGAKVNELLLQTCNVDFRVLEANPSQVILTSMAGVSVTVISVKSSSTPSYRIWCDGTYGIYLWETLAAIAGELGGGCIGLNALP
jgi:sarcosine oxidase subunit gamma